MEWPVLIADRNCPTWSRLTWWDRLLRRKPTRVAYMLPDRTIIVSPATKEFYEKNRYEVIRFQSVIGRPLFDSKIFPFEG